MSAESSQTLESPSEIDVMSLDPDARVELEHVAHEFIGSSGMKREIRVRRGAEWPSQVLSLAVAYGLLWLMTGAAQTIQRVQLTQALDSRCCLFTLPFSRLVPAVFVTRHTGYWTCIKLNMVY